MMLATAGAPVSGYEPEPLEKTSAPRRKNIENTAGMHSSRTGIRRRM